MTAYLIVAAVMGLILGTAIREEDGHEKLLTVVLVSALWPIAIAVGWGLNLSAIARWVSIKARGAQ